MADLKISQLSVSTIAPALAYIPIAASGANWAIPATAAAIGAQPLDATLTAVAGVTTAANKVIYWTGTDTAAATDLTAFGRTFLSSSSSSPARTYLELSSSDDVTFRSANTGFSPSNAVGNGIVNIMTPSATSNGAYTSYGVISINRPLVSSGVTNTGAYWASKFDAMRNQNGAAVDDSGTVTTIGGFFVNVGHDSADAAETPQTTNCYGLSIFGYKNTGTITNFYGVNIGGVSGAGTVTNEFGIYQSGSNAKNHFAGNTGIGTNAPTGKLDVNDSVIRVRTAKTPASAAAAGNQGDIAWDANYIYVCTATNTWKRVAIATW